MPVGPSGFNATARLRKEDAAHDDPCTIEFVIGERASRIRGDDERFSQRYVSPWKRLIFRAFAWGIGCGLIISLVFVALYVHEVYPKGWNTRALRVKNATAEGGLSLVDYNALAAKYGGSEEVQPGKYRVGQYSASDNQSVSSTPLAEQDRKRLDSIVQQMQTDKESDDSIQAVVNDFKQKYSRSDARIQTSQNSTIKSVGAIFTVDLENTTRADITLPQAVTVMQATKGAGALHSSSLKLDRDYFIPAYHVVSVTLENNNLCGAKEDAKNCFQRNFGDQSEIILFDDLPKYEVRIPVPVFRSPHP